MVEEAGLTTGPCNTTLGGEPKRWRLGRGGIPALCLGQLFHPAGELLPAAARKVMEGWLPAKIWQSYPRQRIRAPPTSARQGIATKSPVLPEKTGQGWCRKVSGCRSVSACVWLEQSRCCKRFSVVTPTFSWSLASGNRLLEIFTFWSFLVDSFGWQVSTVSSPGYMGGSKETQGINCQIVPQVPRSLSSLPSFHLSESSYTCLVHYGRVFSPSFFFFF